MIETVELSHRTTLHGSADQQDPAAPALVVLHGFLGGSRSWSGVARKLSTHGNVFTLDLRNHGRSPHSEFHDYPSMAADVELWIKTHLPGRSVALLGHSMGGKVAMTLACQAPDLVRHLYLLDIAPVSYPLDRTVMDALLAVDLSGVKTRSDAEQQLARSIDDRLTRLFLLTNLNRKPGSDGYSWTVPLEVFDREIEKIFVNPLETGQFFAGPTDFISGGESNYVDADRFEHAKQFFPQAEWTVLEGAGHNVHTEGGEAFLSAVGNWAR